MLKSWSIENFKKLNTLQEIALTPMTIIADDQYTETTGLLQSIAMLAQTLSIHGFHHALVTNGPYVQAGTFAEIVGKSAERTLRVRFALDCQRDEEEQDVIDLYKSAHYEIDVTFGPYRERQARTHLISPIEQLVIEDLTLAFRFEFDVPMQKSEERQTGDITSEGLLQLEKTTSRDEQELQNLLLEYPQLRIHYHRHSLFQGTLKYAPTNQHLVEEEEQHPGEHFFVGLSGFLPRELVRRSRGKIIDLHASRRVSLLRGALNLEKASEQISDYFGNRIYYLSEQRFYDKNDPAHFTPTSKLDEVGARGEFAIGVYHANKQVLVNYYDPHQEDQIEASLQDALDSWLSYLGIAEQVHTREKGRNKLSWRIQQKTGQKLLPLPGGKSEFTQVVPLLLLGLLAPSPSLLLLEHPEEQLSQEVQIRLVDFLNSLIHEGKQCLIETSSPTLINSLAQANANDQRAIYTARRDNKGNTHLSLAIQAISTSPS